MDREQVIAKWDGMTPRERDAWVGEDVMKIWPEFDEKFQLDGWKTGPTTWTSSIPNYTTDISAAWALAEQYPIAKLERVEIFEGNVEVIAELWSGFDHQDIVEAHAKTASEAVCLAALILLSAVTKEETE